jgi:hypothetical protein
MVASSVLSGQRVRPWDNLTMNRPEIGVLPCGELFTVSTLPGYLLSEVQLRKELAATIHTPMIVEGLIDASKKLRPRNCRTQSSWALS